MRNYNKVMRLIQYLINLLRDKHISLFETLYAFINYLVSAKHHVKSVS